MEPGPVLVADDREGRVWEDRIPEGVAEESEWREDVGSLVPVSMVADESVGDCSLRLCLALMYSRHSYLCAHLF